MRLSEYLNATGESQTAFAKRAGLNQRLISRIINGTDCRASHAHKVVEASKRHPTPKGGFVSLRDLTIAAEGAA